MHVQEHYSKQIFTDPQICRSHVRSKKQHTAVKPLHHSFNMHDDDDLHARREEFMKHTSQLSHLTVCTSLYNTKTEPRSLLVPFGLHNNFTKSRETTCCPSAYRTNERTLRNASVGQQSTQLYKSHTCTQ